MRLILLAATLAVLLSAYPVAAKGRRRPPVDPAPAGEPSPPLTRALAPMEVWHGPFHLDPVKDPTFEPGQVWHYRTRPTEPLSSAVVCGVDSAAGRGTIVHVQVVGIKMRRRATVVGFVTTVDHLPLTRQALVLSVTTLERTDEGCKDFDAPYWRWRREFLSGSGNVGVYTAPIAETLEFLERSSRSGSGESPG